MSQVDSFASQSFELYDAAGSVFTVCAISVHIQVQVSVRSYLPACQSAVSFPKASHPPDAAHTTIYLWTSMQPSTNPKTKHFQPMMG
jgi:hypothetical protein